MKIRFKSLYNTILGKDPQADKRNQTKHSIWMTQMPNNSHLQNLTINSHILLITAEGDLGLTFLIRDITVLMKTLCSMEEVFQVKECRDHLLDTRIPLKIWAQICQQKRITLCLMTIQMMVMHLRQASPMQTRNHNSSRIITTFFMKMTMLRPMQNHLLLDKQKLPLQLQVDKRSYQKST